MTDTQPILLPVEPPRDRVVEALNRDGEVIERWFFERWCWTSGDFELNRWSWGHVVAECLRPDRGWTLRHVAKAN